MNSCVHSQELRIYDHMFEIEPLQLFSLKLYIGMQNYTYLKIISMTSHSLQKKEQKIVNILTSYVTFLRNYVTTNVTSPSPPRLEVLLPNPRAKRTESPLKLVENQA